MARDERDWKRSLPDDEPWGGCRACRYMQSGDRCAAYPDRIPLIVLDGQVDHLVPRPDQVGDTVFEIADPPDYLARVRIRNGVRHGEQWALDAVERSATLRAVVADLLEPAATQP